MEESQKILIVDDEKDLCEILQFNLESEGFSIDIAHSGEEALDKPIEDFDLILLDIMMGGISGFKTANIIRKDRGFQVPIIFLTAKGEENDVLTGFNVGADDYISKPFSIKEVVARIKAILKRGKKKADEKTNIVYKELIVNQKQKEIFLDGQNISLTRKEFEILLLLMKNMDQYISRDEILKRIWDDDVIVTERNVDVNIARLRKKIGAYATNIKGKSGYGYCFKDKN
ncbi:DNA-binding response regulator, OmpR family, contains REC and winged-helix (wHTH) domain [Mariniphaga anaerophila]|uniref:DNA-binding response regulator, OmpR family, contains REC and winged-helix (WHTH) domain n=1 Tax=Mariniphaga anaerophila TaxID=1484053 RepID=A0A1M5BX22_9BACT|nr:response regulator transcription factor [Mariniphaga anaerophila]SHF47059.1 DNA-binding response regulator, OmpR family, contains REC and winged-helix (wHTH) domain [Mariniphaga anaerophila]